MKLLNKFLMGLAMVSALLINSCKEEDEAIPHLKARLGESQLEIETMNYQIKLEGSAPKKGQSGYWTVLRGTNGVVENINDPESMFSGEPGEIYTLQWTITEEGYSHSDKMDVSFRALDTSFEIEERRKMELDTLRTSFTLHLDAKGTEFGATGEWTFEMAEDAEEVEGAEHAYFTQTDSAQTEFVGMPNGAYTIKWKLTYGSKTDSSTFHVVFDSLKADAGTDQLYTIAYGDDLLYGTLYPAYQEGATVEWTILEGEGGQIHNPNTANTLFSGQEGEIYKLRYALSHGEQSGADTVLYSFNRHHSWTDTDGQTYKTVTINGLEWMAENYNGAVAVNDPVYTHAWYFGLDKDGKIVGEGHPLETEEERKKYGRLYTYSAAEALAPEGWRLPTGDELDAMLDIYGGPSYGGAEIKVGGKSGLDLVFGGIYTSPFISASPEFLYQEEFGFYWYQHDGDDYMNEYISVLNVHKNAENAGNSILVWAYGASVRYVREVQ